MHILPVDPPLASHFSFDLESPPVFPTSTSPATPIACSLIVSSTNSSSPDTWIFDSHLGNGDPPSLGVGDTIVVYRDGRPKMLASGTFMATPAFSGRISHIAGWGSSTVDFGVELDSILPTHPMTIQLPWSMSCLSFLQWIWGWLLPYPRCCTLAQYPKLISTSPRILSSYKSRLSRTLSGGSLSWAERNI
ncbi:hypothetical protein CY34DRAFT_17625 [Suillus luteus UH-Slu-Lm8-n1]|uniref:Uncharacterized protein n=1 Tax=Suillus luteus UH-Slu-Lm8-n1 TaxID=930992 RepID=A0A0C9ZAL8_9AGAM|nr:hypothetical protein CY34DRAFT_17625 [Suillus luteus UH-Slu-Lm8-n1]